MFSTPTLANIAVSAANTAERLPTTATAETKSGSWNYKLLRINSRDALGAYCREFS